MATVGRINKQDVFTCPICLETLKSPKSLPCLHTFCETCIGEFILSTEKRLEKQMSDYPCPVCRTVVTPTNPKDEASQWAASLPHNFTISSLMDNSKSVKQECHLCQRRDKISEATQWCRDCDEALCEECLQLHGFMKLFSDHTVVQIDEMNSVSIVEDPDLSMISDSCPVHSSKVLEAFCYEHQELCCVLCLTLQHRKCENIQAIEEMLKLHKHRIKSLESELSEIKETIEYKIEETRSEKEKKDNTFAGIEDNARQFILSLKAKLESLLVLFLKEMNLTHNEQSFEFESKIKTYEKLLTHIETMQCVTKTVQEHGSLNQMFIHFEKSKSKAKSIVKEASQVLNTNLILEMKLNLCDTLTEVESVDSLGKMDFTSTTFIDIDEFTRDFFQHYTRENIRIF
ncbi:tripartite motif-containing protein 2/3 [Mytilus galloprovincialis]|uniref:Tripartite motif-containing protein 2/3 n=1 Tax=Mytilus galloprovincialis TaxID=29158 RepID=A0A8B6BFJ6_MYTGA|nr:tripartite motif-containing protein 2/3 [Mytilus galloprovincialis]